MICNENAVHFHDGKVAIILIGFDGDYNNFEIFFFFNLMNLNLESEWTFTYSMNDLFDVSEKLYIWS